jgi:hypothetical protein
LKVPETKGMPLEVIIEFFTIGSKPHETIEWSSCVITKNYHHKKKKQCDLYVMVEEWKSVDGRKSLWYKMLLDTM